jgi:hypothetical protein
LEKFFAGFPMIGKVFPNGWKKRAGFSNGWKIFFQWLENRRKAREAGNREGRVRGGKGIGETGGKSAEFFHGALDGRRGACQ